MLQTGLILTEVEKYDKRTLSYSTLFKANRTATRHIIDMREILDQHQKGTCAGFACAYGKTHNERESVSPLFIYMMAKSIDNFGMKEEGTDILSVVKACHKFGSLKEEDLPYSLYKDAPKMQFPTISKELMNKAENMRIESYAKITTDLKDRQKTLNELKDHLLHNQVIVGGFIVGLGTFFEPEFLPNGDAIVQMPEGKIAGHAMIICGFDDNMVHTFKNGKKFKGFVRVAQSYGTEESVREFGEPGAKIWTKSGYGWIPYDYLFGGFTLTGNDNDKALYVNELYCMFDDIPFSMKQVDITNENIKPYIKNSRTFVPLRFIGENLDCKVEFDNYKIKITRGKTVIDMVVGSKIVYVNDKKITLDVAPEIIGDRTFVPIRAISQILGADVLYLGEERRVEIKDKEIGKIIELWIDYDMARIITKK